MNRLNQQEKNQYDVGDSFNVSNNNHQLMKESNILDAFNKQMKTPVSEVIRV